MKLHLLKIIFLMCMCLICPLTALAEVEWELQQVINLEREPIDTVMSDKGKYMFVLTDNGIIHIYDSVGNLKGKIDAGKNVDSIACGPDERVLILKSKKDKEVRRIILDFVQDINIEGSPFKGNADAPIIIAVFTDYQ